MTKNNFLFVRSSLNDFIRNPLLIIPSVLLLIFIFFFSRLSVFVNFRLENANSLLITLWLVFFILFTLLVSSFLFSGFIYLSAEAVRKRPLSIKSFFSSAWKYCLKNFIIIIFIFVLYNIIRLIAHYGATFIGHSLNLQLTTASVVFYLIYFTGLIGVIIFFTFSNFYLVIFNLNINESIRKSISLVKKNYLSVFFIILIFFVINEILSYFGNKLISDIINSIIVFPYFTLLLSRIVIENHK